ncbi:cellulase family glycosylhydrolase [Acetivibrio cellulolyticus]|uniref:cellulase family glycosylhydrolase n=1 Tax=Acetivibrio cellulolyticus TaxID=35830 RepID=UPI0001E2C72C|nr:cellulase family glycosylhydrolase [Acetivibrio cellulolyticus]
MKKPIIFSTILVTLATLLITPGTQISAETTAVAEPNDDWLHVEGNNIVDKYGNKVWITGANWFGFNCREMMFLDSYHSDILADIKIVADKGINVVRIPIATDLLYSWSKGQYPMSTDTSFNNEALEGLNSFELFNFMLENFKKVGIKVILDVHGATTDNQGHIYPLWYNGTITEEIFKSAWVWVANYYKNDDTIIGFDLKNEPHTNTGNVKMKASCAIWDDSNDPNNWKRAAQETALAIMKVHPNALIFVEGVEMYPKDGKWDDATFDTSPWTGNNDYYGNWWGGNLRGVKDYPIDLGEHQDQLVYSPHDYGPLVYEQSWFTGNFVTADDETAQEILYDQCWRDNWAYLMENGTSPLLIGEWGGITEGGDKLLSTNLKYLRCMRNYISQNKYKMHHTLWCINIDSADTGGLFTRGEGTPFEGGRDLKWNDNKYDNYLLPVLWKNEDGKFQGLDHKVPLGCNGVTLPEGGSTTPTKTPATPTKSITPTSIVTPTAIVTPTPTASDVKPGDVDGNGSINSIDFALMRNYLLGNLKDFPAEDDIKAGDLNGDKSINSLDFAIMRMYLLGMITKFSV